MNKKVYMGGLGHAVGRKTIMAIINNALYIDPSDTDKANIEIIKDKAFKAIGQRLDVIVRPINEWMPSTGTEALMKAAAEEAIPSLTGLTGKYINKVELMKNRHDRRAEKKKYGRIY